MKKFKDIYQKKNYFGINENYSILESHIRDNNKYYLTEYKQNISRKSSHQFKKTISNLFISDKYKRETTENMIEKNKKSTISICESQLGSQLISYYNTINSKDRPKSFISKT